MKNFNFICCAMSAPADKKNSQRETVPVDADVVLAQREKDLASFLQRKQQMTTLIKMMAKVAESITGERYSRNQVTDEGPV